jgi:hypothetical protein
MNGPVGELTIEVEAEPSGNLGPRRPAVPEQFKQRAAEIADSVAAVASQFQSRLEERIREHRTSNEVPAPLAGETEAPQWGLDEVELNFQLAVQVEGGVVIKSSGGATFGVKLRWKAAGERA